MANTVHIKLSHDGQFYDLRSTVSRTANGQVIGARVHCPITQMLMLHDAITKDDKSPEVEAFKNSWPESEYPTLYKWVSELQERTSNAFIDKSMRIVNSSTGSELTTFVFGSQNGPSAHEKENLPHFFEKEGYKYDRKPMLSEIGTMMMKFWTMFEDTTVRQLIGDETALTFLVNCAGYKLLIYHFGGPKYLEDNGIIARLDNTSPNNLRLKKGSIANWLVDSDVKQAMDKLYGASQCYRVMKTALNYPATRVKNVITLRLPFIPSTSTGEIIDLKD